EPAEVPAAVGISPHVLLQVVPPGASYLVALAFEGVAVADLVAEAAVSLFESLAADREHGGRWDQAAGTVADLEELRGEPGVRRGFPPACPGEQVTCTSGKTVKVIQDVHPVLHF